MPIYSYNYTHIVVGVMKMGNNAPRGGIEPTSLALWSSVLTIKPFMLPDDTILPMPMWFLLGRSVETTIHVPLEL